MTPEYPLPLLQGPHMLDKSRELGVPRSPLQGADGTRSGHAGREPTGQGVLRLLRANPPCLGEAHWGTGAYTGCLPQALEQPLGRDEELEQAAEAIPLVAALQQPEHLAQDGGSRGFEGRVEGLESALHRRIQRPGILRERGKCRWWESVPAAQTPFRLTRCLCPPSHAALCHCRNAAELKGSKPS